MPEVDDDDWASGIAVALRQMLAAGAADELIESFIKARRSGDSHQPMALGTPPELAIAIERLRIAALRPVVNHLDVATLRTYIEIILSITDQVVRSEQDHRCWSSASFVERLAISLMNVALEHIHSESPTATRRGPSR